MKLNTLHTLAAAIALTLLGSCSSDEVIKDSDGNQRIVFSVATENASRAAEGYYFGSTQTPKEFFVWAQVKVGDTYSKYFEEQLFKKQKSDDKYVYVNDLPYFWPKNTNDKLKFYAFNGNPATWRKIGKDDQLYNGAEYTMFQGAKLMDDNTYSYNDTWVTYSAGNYNYKTGQYGVDAYEFGGFTMSDPSILFFQNEGAMRQTDLLYACTEKSRSNLVDGNLKLNFRHALAMVCMEFQNNMPNTCVEILDFGTVNTPIQAKCTITGATDVQFINTSQSGTAPEPSCKWSDWQYDGFSPKYLNDHTTKQHNWFWIGERKDDKINQLRGPRKDADGNNRPGDYLNASNYNATADFNPGNTKENGFGYQSAFLMIPMKGTGVEAYKPADGQVYHQKGTCIVLKLRIKNVADPTKNDGYPTAKDEYIWVDTRIDHKDEGAEIAIPMKFEWEAGKKYIYKITFEKGGSAGYGVTDGKPAIVPIKLALEVDDFSNGGEYGVTL